MANHQGFTPWNKGRTKFTDPSVRSISETMRKKKIDNFAKWRDKAKSTGVIPDSNRIFLKTDSFATLIGLILGDGNISLCPRTECLRITLGTDKPLLVSYASSLVESVIGKRPTIIKRTNSNCFNVTLSQKNLGKRLGISLGARGKTEVLFPRWIWAKKHYLIAILRGLFEAEAYFCVHEGSYTYNFEFSNRNVSLLNEVEKGLKLLGYVPERRLTSVRLRKKKEAISFRKLISFREYPVITPNEHKLAI